MTNKFKDIDGEASFKKERNNQIKYDAKELEDRVKETLLKSKDQTEMEKRNKIKTFMKERQKQIEHDEKLIMDRISRMFNSKKNYNGGLSR